MAVVDWTSQTRTFQHPGTVMIVGTVTIEDGNDSVEVRIGEVGSFMRSVIVIPTLDASQTTTVEVLHTGGGRAFDSADDLAHNSTHKLDFNARIQSSATLKLTTSAAVSGDDVYTLVLVILQ